MKTMYINGQKVGSGQWPLKSVLSFCDKKEFIAQRAYSIFACASYAETQYLNLDTGEYNSQGLNDHFGREGLN